MSDNSMFTEEINNLLSELDSSKKEVNSYITQVESMKENISKIFPTQSDYRNKYLLDDKLRTFSEFFNTLLRLRQEKHKLILDEIKIRTPKKEDNETFDIRSVIKELKKEQENGE